MLIATICRTEAIAVQISNSYLIKMLQDLLGAKQEDDEMVQQILNTFFKFLFFKSTREIVLHKTQMVQIVLELLTDKNPNIKGLVNAILDYVQIHDQIWRNEIKTRRFEVHNANYITAMQEFEAQTYGEENAEGLYDDMYYYDQLNEGLEEQLGVDLSGLDPKQRAEQIQQLRALVAAQGDDYDSEDDAMFFDNNDLANRLWNEED